MVKERVVMNHSMSLDDEDEPFEEVNFGGGVGARAVSSLSQVWAMIILANFKVADYSA
jgi:hypothetical protein